MKKKLEELISERSFNITETVNEIIGDGRYNLTKLRGLYNVLTYLHLNQIPALTTLKESNILEYYQRVIPSIQLAELYITNWRESNKKAKKTVTYQQFNNQSALNQIHRLKMSIQLLESSAARASVANDPALFLSISDSLREDFYVGGALAHDVTVEAYIQSIKRLIQITMGKDPINENELNLLAGVISQMSMYDFDETQNIDYIRMYVFGTEVRNIVAEKQLKLPFELAYSNLKLAVKCYEMQNDDFTISDEEFLTVETDLVNAIDDKSVDANYKMDSYHALVNHYRGRDRGCTIFFAEAFEAVYNPCDDEALKNEYLSMKSEVDSILAELKKTSPQSVSRDESSSLSEMSLNFGSDSSSEAEDERRNPFDFEPMGKPEPYRYDGKFMLDNEPGDASFLICRLPRQRDEEWFNDNVEVDKANEGVSQKRLSPSNTDSSSKRMKRDTVRLFSDAEPQDKSARYFSTNAEVERKPSH